MFTGIISEIGRLRARRQPDGGDARFMIDAPKTATGLGVGASVACNGVCLSVVELEQDGFAVDVSAATLSCTTCGDWLPGRAINLERALRARDEISGHLVFGHIDAVATMSDIVREGSSLRMVFAIKESLAPYIAVKGSIAVDGVSLTVNQVERDSFTVNIISHTRQETTFSGLGVHDAVNIEIDMLARYVARFTGFQG